MIGQYVTRFDEGLVGRTTNLRLAVAAIDGRILQPGEVFSLNDTVGERTPRARVPEGHHLRRREDGRGLRRRGLTGHRHVVQRRPRKRGWRSSPTASIPGRSPICPSAATPRWSGTSSI
ncbi:MAG: VanW family protein [Gammaproteobacteria bacterium]|nr:VanW family protein [Gammaproteobacteria bacterium]